MFVLNMTRDILGVVLCLSQSLLYTTVTKMIGASIDKQCLHIEHKYMIMLYYS